MNGVPLQPLGAGPSYTIAEALALPKWMLSSIAASCAESMYAMFVALAPSSQVRNAPYAVLNEALVEMTNRLPFALRRHIILFRTSRQLPDSSMSLLLRMAWPLLLDQNPSVSPPPAPRQTFPKFTTSAWSHCARLTV